MSWTDERVELLTKLWSEGLSASHIAAELGGGVSRNAVIGKVHRLGLAGRARPVTAPAPRSRKAPAPRPAGVIGVTPVAAHVVARPQAAAQPLMVRGNTALATMTVAEALPVREVLTATEVVVPLSDPVSIMELREHTCRWPLGDPASAEFRYCGARKGEAGCGPYCSHHARMAYQPVLDRRRERRH